MRLLHFVQRLLARVAGAAQFALRIKTGFFTMHPQPGKEGLVDAPRHTQKGGAEQGTAACMHRARLPIKVCIQAQEGRMEQELSQAGDEQDEDLERDLQRMRLQEKRPTPDRGTAGRL